MTIQTTLSPTGEKLVTMTAEEYQDLVDARDAAIAMRDISAGTMPTLEDKYVDDYLAAPTHLAFWRKHRAMTQVALAAAVGISQPYLAQIESGARSSADIRVYASLARHLGVRIEDLLED
jgi:DNA-binding XRE family transcriptional regulator